METEAQSIYCTFILKKVRIHCYIRILKTLINCRFQDLTVQTTDASFYRYFCCSNKLLIECHLLISSHLMQRVLLSEIKLFWTLTSLSSNGICQSERQYARSHKHVLKHLWKLNKNSTRNQLGQQCDVCVCCRNCPVLKTTVERMDNTVEKIQL